jgi:putative SOS response-associated peptidase YedK
LSGPPLHSRCPATGQNGFLCGRYVTSKAAGDLLSHFGAKEIEGSLPPPSWNVALTQDVPIIAEKLDDDSVDRRLLIARSESILDKPSFRKAAIKRRDLVPAERYYECQKTEGIRCQGQRSGGV